MEKYASIADLVRRAPAPMNEADLARELTRHFPQYARPEGRVRQFFFEVRNRRREGKQPYGGDIIGIGPDDPSGAPARLWVVGRSVQGGAPAVTSTEFEATPPCQLSSPPPRAAFPTSAVGHPSFATNTSRTQERIARLSNYMTREVMDGSQFVCTSALQCRESVAGMCFYEGQLSHVGSRYDVRIDRLDLRVVVVAMSYGHKPSHVSFGKRTAMLRKDAEGIERRTPHMRGTLLALRAVFGLPTDDGVEFIGDRTWANHLYNYFALVNALLCSAVSPAGGKKDRASRVMKSQCRRHLFETLRILEPTIVILQGQAPFEAIAESTTVLTDHLSVLDLGSSRSLAAHFSHPSAWADQNWSTSERPYFRNVVLPTINDAKSRLASGV